MPTKPYLIAHPPKETQYRERRRGITGCIVIHTAESAPDVKGPDDGNLNVAKFIENRSDPGCYHSLSDSDDSLPLVPFHMATFGDGTGSNDFAIHLSMATQAARWATLPKEWREACVKNLAAEAARAAKWLQRVHDITVPGKRISREQSDAGMAGFIAHAQRDPGRRSDPGADFPWALFFIEYNRLMADPVPSPAPEPAPAKPSKLGRGAHVDHAIKDLRVAKENADHPAKLAKINIALKALKSIEPKERTA